MISCRGVAGPKKHRCPDCTFCQWCSDSRCNVCRGRCGRRAAGAAKKKTPEKGASRKKSKPAVRKAGK